MESQQKTFQKRQVAYKLRVSDILKGRFAKDELSSGYIKVNELNVSRVNLIGTIVYKPEQQSGFPSVIVDDGTGKIVARSFENSPAFSKIEVGDAVLIIGKIREYNNERYIVPEIMKKLESIEWFNVRKLELKNFKAAEEEIKEEPVVEAVDEKIPNIADGIYTSIRKLDAGDGVLVDDILKEIPDAKTEQIINKLLESGDIFEISPGKVKILE